MLENAVMVPDYPSSQTCAKNTNGWPQSLTASHPMCEILKRPMLQNLLKIRVFTQLPFLPVSRILNGHENFV